jgi:hypothetical protein
VQFSGHRTHPSRYLWLSSLRVPTLPLLLPICLYLCLPPPLSHLPSLSPSLYILIILGVVMLEFTIFHNHPTTPFAFQPLPAYCSKVEPWQNPKRQQSPEHQYRSFLSGSFNFSPNNKKFIILTASTAAFFSPLASNIYLPGLNLLARDLHVSDSKINLTGTTYLVSGLFDASGTMMALLTD